MPENTAPFTPVTVTVETLQVLSRQPHYSNLLALYMAYVEITTWQGTHSIKATNEFMIKRLQWGKTKLIRTKRKLVDLNLIESMLRRDGMGAVESHYLLVKHIVATRTPQTVPLDDENTRGTIHHPVGFGTTNTTNSNKSTTNTNTIHSSSEESTKKKERESIDDRYMRQAIVFPSLVKSLGFSVDRVKLTPKRDKLLRERLKLWGPDEIDRAANAIRQNDFMQGENKSNRRYGTIDYLIRSDEIVDNWFNQAPDPVVILPENTEELERFRRGEKLGR